MLGALLEVALGLIVIYLLLGLICTAANELIAGLVNARARNLVHGLNNLLRNSGTESEVACRFFRDPFIKALNKPLKKPLLVPEYLYGKARVKRFFDLQSAPSYLPPKVFVLALLKAISGDSEKIHDMSHLRQRVRELRGPDDLKDLLLALLEDAQEDVDTFKENLEDWFNTSMDRVAALYRKKTQAVLLLLALLITVAANADTLEIARSLAVHDDLRKAVVERVVQENWSAAAQEAGEGGLSPQPSVASLKQSLAELRQFGLPLGWQTTPQGFGGWVAKLFGLLLTAVAVSLGAPFWFDILKKVMNVRATGASPEELAKKRKKA